MAKSKKDKDKGSEKAKKKADEKAAKAAEKAAEKAAKAAEKAEPKAEAKAPDAVTEKAPDKVVALADKISERLRVGDGFRLEDLDPAATPAFKGGEDDAVAAMAETAEEVATLQEMLYAQAKGGGRRSLLLVVQGMDTSGKGGIMRHVVGLMDPQGVKLTAFKAPSPEERRHPFLWRIRNALPEPGQVGVFDRSQYEDVLVVRVHNLVPPATWSRRYAQINAFEKSATDRGIHVLKVMLHVSKEEQKARLAERLDRADKYWKFNPGDIDERACWDDYQSAYQAVLDKTSTQVAPWYVVPADKKWYARLAVQQLILEALRAIDPQWPPADFDIAEQQARLAAT